METELILTEKDYLRLSFLLSQCEDEEMKENLEIEIERAKIVSDDEIPHDVVTMNSRLRYLDKTKNQENIVTVVYPDQASTEEGRISIFSSLGAALLGLRVNQEINWMFPDKETRTIKVLEVLYQPEASGDWHL